MIEAEILYGNKSNIINYGCGKNRLDNSTNVDLIKNECVDIAITDNSEYQELIKKLDPKIILCINPYKYYIENELIFRYLSVGGYVILVGSERNPYIKKYLEKRLSCLEILESSSCNDSIVNFGEQHYSSGELISEDIKNKNIYILMKKAAC